MSKTNVIDKRNIFTSLNVSTKAWSVYVDLDFISSHGFFDEYRVFFVQGLSKLHDQSSKPCANAFYE